MRFFKFNKKRFIVISFSLLISISLLNLNKNKSNVETMVWVSNPKTIVIDPGHGFPDERC